MSKRWPASAKPNGLPRPIMELMHSRYVDGIVIRPLQDGDTATVQAVFARLGDRSRRRRFGAAKPRLSEPELALLARVDRAHHVLVAYIDGDERPAGIARLVRQGRVAEVAFEVADECQGRGIGTALAATLAGDARAAGIDEFHATVAGDNPRAVSLISRCTRGLRETWLGGELELVAALD
jgi:ribosomal protein S18 acetylase RimI-like enzyme